MEFGHAEKMFKEHGFVIGGNLEYHSVLLVGISELVCISLYFDGTAENDADEPRRIRSKYLNYGTEFSSDDNDKIERSK